MKIKINNDIFETAGPVITVSELLSIRGFSPTGTAVAVNDRLIARDRWDIFKIEEDDDVTIISAAFGG